jgi:hypothetical protein
MGKAQADLDRFAEDILTAAGEGKKFYSVVLLVF